VEESDIEPLCLNKQRHKGRGRKSNPRRISLFLLAFLILTGSILYQWKNGETILIKRALPVRLIIEGKEETVWTHALTVAELLHEKGVQLNEDDLVYPSLAEQLSPGQTVKVIRIVKERLIETEEIPFDTVRVANPLLEYGAVKVIEEGSPGIRENVIEVVKREEEELSREMISSRVIKEPKVQLMEYGVKNTLSRGGRIYEYDQVLEVVATAYCPGTPGSGCPIDERGASQCTGFNNDGYTYTGVRAIAGDGSPENPHIIAIDPAVIPLKTLVFIEGYGFARAEDTGSAIKGKRIDLLFDKHHDAWLFGRKVLKVFILK